MKFVRSINTVSSTDFFGIMLCEATVLFLRNIWNT